MRLDRRGFLQHLATGSAVLSFGGVVPLPLLVSAERTVAERILVVIELQGGNDGLNTVIPVTDPLYRRRRPTLAIPQSEVLSIADGMGFHPALRGFADLLEAGQLAVVQQVGYPQPNRSHFESMDIWHTCLRKDQQRPDGWLGRWAERVQGAGGDATALHLGPDKLPFALMSRSVRVPSVRSLEEFRLRGAEDEKFREAVQSLAETRRDEPDDLLNFVASSTASALTASERLATTAKAAAHVQPGNLHARAARNLARRTDVMLPCHGVGALRSGVEGQRGDEARLGHGFQQRDRQVRRCTELGTEVVGGPRHRQLEAHGDLGALCGHQLDQLGQLRARIDRIGRDAQRHGHANL